MPRTERFFEVPKASSYQAAGIALAKNGEFAEAHEAFDYAQILVARAEIDPQSQEMQTARIIRDDGFTFVREALAKSRKFSEERLISGLTQLEDSLQRTESLLDRRSTRYHTEAWWFLRAEHGATLGLIARLATAAYVLRVPSKTKPLNYYVDAHRTLHLASNRYYETSNGMNAARQMVLEGQIYSAREVWLKRAAKSVDRAKTEDPRNAKAAERDFNRRQKFLRTPRIAHNSVFRAP